MKKLGFVIFVAALVIGILISNFSSFDGWAIKSPVSLVFGSKIEGSGNAITQNRNTGEFKSVDVGGIIRVEIEQNGTRSVRVEADDNIVPLIRTEVSDGTLQIYSDRKFKTRNRVTVFISNPVIEEIETSGVADVSFKTNGQRLLKIHSSGASRIAATGKVENLEVDMSGASKIRADKLTAESANIDGSGASSILIDVGGILKADVSGASSVSYTGDVSVLKKSVSGAASVCKVK